MDEVFYSPTYTAKTIDRPFAEDSRVYRFTASTADVDHAKHAVPQDQWDLSVYENNPVVFWCHRKSDLPIALSVRTGLEDDNLTFFPKFLTEEEAGKEWFKFVDSVERQVRHNIIRGCSVGFIPTNPPSLEKAADGEEIIQFNGQKLIEISIAPVPMNPNTMRKNVDGLEPIDLPVLEYLMKDVTSRTEHVSWAEQVADVMERKGDRDAAGFFREGVKEFQDVQKKLGELAESVRQYREISEVRHELMAGRLTRLQTDVALVTPGKLEPEPEPEPEAIDDDVAGLIAQFVNHTLERNDG